MNILPKKRWHVRTKENIARVRRDEAEAAAEEKERQRRALLAEQESRTAALREKARCRLGDNLKEQKEQPDDDCGSCKDSHINLFQDVEDGKIVTDKTNAEFEREQKEEKEKYEKQIGYLTYLGQDTVEATGKVSWYNKVPERLSDVTGETEIGGKNKFIADPLNMMKKFLPSSEWNIASTVKLTTPTNKVIKIDKMNFRKEQKRKVKKHKKHKEKTRHGFKHNKKCKRRRNYSSDSCDDNDKSRGKQSSKRKCKKRKYGKDSSSSSSGSSDANDGSDSCEETPKRCKVDLEPLRAERLRREKEERLKTEALLATLRGDPPPPVQVEVTNNVAAVKQKYNSQFNPDLARQNFQHVSL